MTLNGVETVFDDIRYLLVYPLHSNVKSLVEFNGALQMPIRQREVPPRTGTYTIYRVILAHRGSLRFLLVVPEFWVDG